MLTNYNTTTMTSQEWFDTLRRMSMLGGKFYAELANALRYADPMNRDKIIATFPDIVARYGPASRFAASETKSTKVSAHV